MIKHIKTHKSWPIKLAVSLFVMSVIIKADDSFVFYLSTQAGQSPDIIKNALLPPQNYLNSTMGADYILSNKVKTYFKLNHFEILNNPIYNNNSLEIGLLGRNLSDTQFDWRFGVNGGISLYTETYSYYRYLYASAYIRAKHYFNPGTSTEMKYSIHRIYYPGLEEASNFQHSLAFNINTSFFTKTALLISPNISTQIFDQFIEPNIWGGRSKYATISFPQRTRLTFNVRLSQSISDNWGSTAWLSTQKVFKTDGTTMYILDSHDNPFIDEFRWSGSSIYLRNTYRFNDKHSMLITVSQQTKNYLDVPVYIYDLEKDQFLIDENGYYLEQGIRSTKIQKISVSLNTDMGKFISSWLRYVDLKLTWEYGKSLSNDFLHDIQGHGVALEINYTY